MKQNISLLLMIGFVAVMLSACGGRSAEPQKIRVAVLPILDALPIFVAESQGYFEEQGLEVEIVPVSSAPERDQLMQSGQVDAILNELVSTIFYNQEETRVVTVRYLRIATAEYPMFRIIASQDSGIVSVDDLKGVPIGISEGTVIAYVTDRILEKQGFTQDDIEVIAIPKIPDRLALLASGELEAGVLPDPAASLVVMQGGVVVVDDTSYPEISSSMLSFSASAVEENPDGVRAFLAALEQAVADINADKQKWNELLTEKSLVPPPLMGSYTIPDFPAASTPTEAQFDDALDWAQDNGFVSAELRFEDSIDSSFLP
jgi:NitT/TauT family transport system substrate-binding protein